MVFLSLFTPHAIWFPHWFQNIFFKKTNLNVYFRASSPVVIPITFSFPPNMGLRCGKPCLKYDFSFLHQPSCSHACISTAPPCLLHSFTQHLWMYSLSSESVALMCSIWQHMLCLLSDLQGLSFFKSGLKHKLPSKWCSTPSGLEAKGLH